MCQIAVSLGSWLAILTFALPCPIDAATGRVEFRVVEQEGGMPVPCRIHLKDAQGTPQRAGDLPFWFDHFVCPGTVALDLTPGSYTYEVERGPEYLTRSGTVTVAEGSSDKVNARLERIADMAEEGWWSGDLHVHRPLDQIELLMRAEDLHMAPVITWWNDRNFWSDHEPPANLIMRFDGNRFAHVMAGEDEREGGAILYFHLDRPLAVAGAKREYPSPLKFVSEARQRKGVWLDVEKPFWWDVPVWIACGAVDSLGLANNHMCRDRMYESEAWGRPRDAERLAPPLGNGYYSQEVYYHVLNCGLRIPPSAGSASGVLPNPVGYNRIYVHLDEEVTYDAWWNALREGRSFVTNGPLLRVRAEGALPGHVFRGPAGQQLTIDVKATLTTRDPLHAVEIVKDGLVERAVPYEDVARTDSLGELNFTESGWFLVRAIAANPKTFRFAATAPFYVEIGEKPRRVSRSSTQFFLDWVRERLKRITLDDPAQRAEVLKYHRQAEAFWQDLLAKANAD